MNDSLIAYVYTCSKPRCRGATNRRSRVECDPLTKLSYSKKVFRLSMTEMEAQIS